MKAILAELGNDGVFSAEGEDWKRQRRLAVTALNTNESKTAMAMIARNFEVELDDSRGPVQEQLSFTMVPQGLHLRLRERTEAHLLV